MSHAQPPRSPDRLRPGHSDAERCDGARLRPDGVALALQAAELDEADDPLPQIVAVQKRREGRGIVGRQRADARIRTGLVEKGNRAAHLLGAEHTMFGGADATAAPALEHLSEIDRETLLERRDVDPVPARGPGLQARYPILREHGEESGIGMRCAGEVASLT